MAGPPQSPRDLYDPGFVRGLFDAMSGSYERVNVVTSFGFSRRWRRQCVERLRLAPGMRVLDWMAGMGESWPYVLPAIAPTGRLTAVDLSPGMLGHARRRLDRLPGEPVDLREGDVLRSGEPDASADAVVALFGVKTLSVDQRRELALEIARVLRPGGRYSLIEVSVPRRRLLSWPYLFYLKVVIPLLGLILLGNPENYRMLGVYTERFGDCRALVDPLRAAGLEATFSDHFFGCATGVWGVKPAIAAVTAPLVAGRAGR